ncbi:alpha/beta hydrolase [Sphingomonas sp. VNH70]|uniref:alpha/beta fold hydrolase n=1 Tax=Sphingomonas silueang TaxID=3156617 RepID=UPI0032B34571
MTNKLRKTAVTTALIGGVLVGWTAIAAVAADAMVPPDGRFVDVPGGRLHYVDTGGDGPVIVMLHGLYGQLRNFSYALTAELERDHRLILIDRPGWGHSTVEGTQPPIEVQARMIADAIDALGLDRPLLVGHSMGGAVALALALDHPAKIGGVALIAPLTRPLAALPAVFTGKAPPAPLRALAAWTIATPLSSLTGLLVAKKIFAPDAVPGDFGTRGGGMASLRPSAYEAGAFEIHAANPSLEAMVPRYGVLAKPVAILYGRDDNLLDPLLHGEATAAAIPAATLTTIAGGHMLPVTHPGEVARWLRPLAR